MTTNTGTSSIVRCPPGFTAMMHTAEITRRLKDAEPTIVAGPRPLCGGFPSVLSVSTTARRISGAEEPSAIKERFAIVEFQTCCFCVSPVRKFFASTVDDVMTSIAPMNLSLTTPTPIKR